MEAFQSQVSKKCCRKAEDTWEHQAMCRGLCCFWPHTPGAHQEAPTPAAAPSSSVIMWFKEISWVSVLISYAGQGGPTSIVSECIRAWRPTFQNISKGLRTREFPVRSVRVWPPSPTTHKKLKSARLVFASVRFKWSRCLSASVRSEHSQYFHSNPPRLPLGL